MKDRTHDLFRRFFEERPELEPLRPALLGASAVGAAERVALFDGKTLAGWDVLKCEAVVEGGEILLSAGRSSEDRLEPTSIMLEPGRRIVGEGRVLTTPVRTEQD